MVVNTKLNINDYGYFLFQGEVRKERITAIEIRVTADGLSIDYLVSKNPCGSQYTRYFNDCKIFKSKEELLNSL